MIRYQVKDWNKHFENDRSRAIDQCSWLPIPNKRGMSLTYILSLEDGRAIFADFILLLQALSKQRTPRHGWLTFDGTGKGAPWSLDVIARACLTTPTRIERLLAVLCSPEVGWILKHEDSTTCERDLNGSKVTPNSQKNPVEGRKEEKERKKEEKDTVADATAVSPAIGKSDQSATRAPKGTDKPRSPKGDCTLPGFDRFWASYPASPRKVNRAECFRKWQRLDLEKITEQVIAGLLRWKASRDWTKDDGAYICAPLVFINQARWESVNGAEQAPAKPLPAAVRRWS